MGGVGRDGNSRKSSTKLLLTARASPFFCLGGILRTMPARPSLPEGVATREQILVWLSQAAAGGHVGAMRLLLEEHRRVGEDTAETPSVIDELASKRAEA